MSLPFVQKEIDIVSSSKKGKSSNICILTILSYKDRLWYLPKNILLKLKTFESQLEITKHLRNIQINRIIHKLYHHILTIYHVIILLYIQ